MTRLLLLSRAFWLLLALIWGPLGVQPQQQDVPSTLVVEPSAGAITDDPATVARACCLRPKDSQNEFQVVIMVLDDDLEERKEYYADFGKEMVPEGSMVLYKGKMGLLNADCSVTGGDYSFPVNGNNSSSSQPANQGVRLPLTMLLIASTISFLFFLEQ